MDIKQKKSFIPNYKFHQPAFRIDLLENLLTLFVSSHLFLDWKHPKFDKMPKTTKRSTNYAFKF